MKKKMPVWAKGIIILLIIAALIGAIAAVNGISPGEEDNIAERTDVPRYDVYRSDSDKVSRIKISSAENTLVFKNNDGTWTLNDIDPSEVAGNKIDSLLMSVLTVISNYEIEKDPADLSIYGLDDPALTIEIENKDLSVDKFIVGDKSPVTGEYFYMRDGGDIVYSIYETKVSQMMKNEEYYREFSRFSVETGNLDEIIIQRKGKNNIHLRVKDDLSSAISVYNIWEMTEPYDGVYNAIDQFVEDKIITPMNSLNISKIAEKRDDYGLDDPEFIFTVKSVTFDDNGKKTGEETTQVLKISKNFESKRFVMIDGRDGVYEISSSSADFMNTDEFLIISKLAVLRDIADTSKVTVTRGGEEYIMDISHSDDNRNFEFKINGRDADSDESKKKYQDIISISADGLCNNEPV
ncbi:MAG: DUF4340 domain-containing protein, partial [Oscillospiraceae bacterium]|nr:DUF4340 domain-containing protein [Oscillospiraceae bacterium]